jgi:hypothetical protein
MKEQLELKHIVGYLPYGLKYSLPLESERYESIMENEPFRLAIPFLDEKELKNHLGEYINSYFYQNNPQIMWEDGSYFLGQLQSSLGFEEDDVFLSEVKPILFPISSLTEFREDLVFVPIEKLGYGEEKDLAMTLMFDKNELIELPYRTIQKLYEWKIDIHNLIEKGLAISVSEEFNPYK